MIKLPQVDVGFDELYRMIIEPIRAKLMLTAIELGVFDQLSEPGSAEDVARAIGTHPGNTRLFLDGLAACGLVAKENGLYRNEPASQAFLTESSPAYLGQFLNYQNQTFYSILDNLTGLVKEGPPPAQDSPVDDEDLLAYFADRAPEMANYQRAGVGQNIAKIISALPEFPSFRRMLDLGSGPGLIGLSIVAAHPDMEGVIFDLPAVAKAAESYVGEYGMEDRLEVVGGDYTRDPIGNGYDLILASFTLNFAKDDIDPVIEKIYDALNPGGVFTSFAEGLTRERTQPALMVLSMMPMALMGQDMTFDKGFITDSMLRVGFKTVRSRTLDMPFGPVDLDIARK